MAEATVTKAKIASRNVYRVFNFVSSALKMLFKSKTNNTEYRVNFPGVSMRRGGCNVFVHTKLTR